MRIRADSARDMYGDCDNGNSVDGQADWWQRIVSRSRRHPSVLSTSHRPWQVHGY